MAERERAHPLQLAILYTLWRFSKVQTIRLDVHGGIYRPGRSTPGKVVRVRCWTGSIAGLAVYLELAERTLRYHLAKLDDRGKCYVTRLQRGYPTFQGKQGSVVAPPRNSIFQVCTSQKHVRAIRATRRETIEGKRTRRRNAGMPAPNPRGD